MAAAQLTASSISARSFPSFGGLRPSNAKFGSPAAVSLVGQRSFPGLVVKAATAVAPKGEVAAVWEGKTSGKTKETIADILTAIRNADMREKRTVRIPSTNMSENIVKILLREGFIENVRKHQETNKFFLVITLKYRKNNKGPNKTSLNLKQISKPGLRIYAKYHKIPRVLGGMGIVIVSTSRGVMTDREARIEKVGGEILCYVW